jgi:membrane-associated phospholipid phosphatase
MKTHNNNDGVNMRKSILVFFVILSFCINLYGQTDDVEHSASSNNVPLNLVFYNIGWNLFDSVTYNYGLNFIGAGVGTWAAIETGVDLRWRNFAYHRPALANACLVSLNTAYVVHIVTPTAFYLIGRNNQDKKMQITALALTQSMILTVGVQSSLKMITGREEPKITYHRNHHKRGLPTDDYSRKFDWFNMDFVKGWPSGHTANAFSAAATISEIYKDNWWIKGGAYTYAVLMGFSVSVNVHWASEVFAGALIGYAIGKTVGRSFNRLLLEEDEPDNNVSFFLVPNGIGAVMRF